MADAMATLRVARAALQEGLITDADYELVKSAFVKAQQFKAGLDAGFITETDYSEVKSRFLDAFYGLNLADGVSLSGSLTPQRPASPGMGQPAPVSVAARQLGMGGGGGSSSNLGGGAGSMPQSPSVATHQSSLGNTPAASPPPSQRGSDVGGGGNNEVPSNIPSMGGALRKKIAGPQSPSGANLQQQGLRRRLRLRTSMSGISVSDDAINLFYYMKAKSTYRWAMWGINPKGNEIVILDVGRKDSDYADFVARLPESECRFAVYDFQVTNSEGRVFDKLVFFSWSPDTASIKQKMMAASSKDYFKSHLEGLAVELQVSDVDEISEDEIREHVLSVLTRK